MASFTLPSTDGRTVTVLGGGVLGRRIACSWAAGGYDVAIRDPSPEQRDTAASYCTSSMHLFSQETKRGTVTTHADLAPAVEKAWLVIEAVPENLKLKISTFEELEKSAPADAILATNSSSYKSREMITDRTSATKVRVLNMHYYMPPDNVIVELMTCGETNPEIFPFLVDILKKVKMHPYVARKESTGFIFNRLWAAVKRETLNILAEEVATPQEIDQLWGEMFNKNPSGPCAAMDSVGLDTVSFIEQHYVEERGLPDTPVEFLKPYIQEGRLGNKSDKGGLLPPPSPQANGVQLYFLDVGLLKQNYLHGGSILVGGHDGRPPRTLVAGLDTPDGIDVSTAAGRLFWTSMGAPPTNDGSVWSCNLDGSDVRAIIPKGIVHTPKQLVVDSETSKLYFCDREGMRVLRCNFDGSHREVLIKTGDWENSTHKADQTRWCVGIAVSHKTGKIYWTQKGASKASQGRIFQANIDMPAGEDPASRSDVECLFQNLPEPIDLVVDETHDMLYWSDRGEYPKGCSVNSAALNKLRAGAGDDDYEILVRGLHETIGVRLDLKNEKMYVADLGGSLYRFNLDGKNKVVLHSDSTAAFAGVALSYSKA